MLTNFTKNASLENVLEFQKMFMNLKMFKSLKLFMNLKLFLDFDKKLSFNLFYYFQKQFMNLNFFCDCTKIFKKLKRKMNNQKTKTKTKLFIGGKIKEDRKKYIDRL